MNKTNTGYRLKLPLRTEKEVGYMGQLEQTLEKSSLSNVEKAINFPLYAPRQAISSFLFKYDLFQRVQNVHGSIVECGVAYGSGLMSFAHFSSIFEPVNHTRKVIGFDTFEGFPSLSSKDRQGQDPHAEVGGMSVESYEELQACRELYDQNRFVGHINKIELVKGDIMKTAPQYLKDNPHLVVALLYLDFDLYEPTKAALKTFLPRMPKGAVVAFDEVNHPDWPGETLAVMEELGFNNIRLQRVPYDSVRSFAVLE